MNSHHNQATITWRTKPTDRFVLKWIKLHLSAPVTLFLLRFKNVQPWMITISAASLGCAAGISYALGNGWLAGSLAAIAQILDGTDGQLARLTNRGSAGGAFWDSVLDRYADGMLVIGASIYLMRSSDLIPDWLLLTIAALAVIGSSLISYSTARGETLSLDLGRPTIASKGTRTAVSILAAWATLLWQSAPLIALVYIAIHSNLVIVSRLRKVRHQ
jgi:phosphatidylglycerophosphate synthase